MKLFPGYCFHVYLTPNSFNTSSLRSSFRVCKKITVIPSLLSKIKSNAVNCYFLDGVVNLILYGFYQFLTPLKQITFKTNAFALKVA